MAQVFAAKFCNIDLTYCVSAAHDQVNATFTIVAATRGWAAIGLNSAPMMPGTDVVAVWLNNDGSITVSDRWNRGYMSVADDVQNVDGPLDGSSFKNGMLTVVFRRRLVSLDKSTQDQTITPDVKQTWIFAMSDYNPGNTSPISSMSKHTWVYPAPEPIILVTQSANDSVQITTTIPIRPLWFDLAHSVMQLLAWMILMVVIKSLHCITNDEYLNFSSVKGMRAYTLLVSFSLVTMIVSLLVGLAADNIQWTTGVHQVAGFVLIGVMCLILLPSVTMFKFGIVKIKKWQFRITLRILRICGLAVIGLGIMSLELSSDTSQNLTVAFFVVAIIYLIWEERWIFKRKKSRIAPAVGINTSATEEAVDVDEKPKSP